MCEICDLIEELEKAGKDLSFRLSQHAHAIRMGNDEETAVAASSAINALHAMLNVQKRMIHLAIKLKKTDGLDEILGMKGDRKSPSMH